MTGSGPALAKTQLFPAELAGLPRYYPEWCLVGLVAIVDMVWLARSQLQIVGDPIAYFAPKYAVAILCLFAGLLIARRMRGDASRLAHVVSLFAQGLSRIAFAGLLMLSFTIAVVVLDYLLASVALPLWDARLAAADAMLGFDWIGLLRWSNENEWIAWILVAAYHSFLFQGVATLLVLSFMRKRDLREYIMLFAASALVTTLINGLMPASGAYIFHAPDPQLYTNLGYKPGIWHLEVFNGLRSGQPFAFDLAHLEGIVTFPSFHTTLAIIMTYAWRHVRFFFWPVAALNSALVVSTLPVGGHYLVDVIAGAGLAGLCVLAVRALEGRRPFHGRTRRHGNAERSAALEPKKSR